MLSLTTEQRIAKEKFILNCLLAQADVSNANDSDAGDGIAFSLEEYHNMLGLEVLSDEVTVYDTRSGYPRILKRNEITLEITGAIGRGELIVKQSAVDAGGYTEVCDEIPACFDLQGNPCTPFSYIPCSGLMSFNPDFVDIQVFDSREAEYFSVTLSELTEEDISDISSGVFQITENEDMYERYMAWRSGIIEEGARDI